MLTKPSRKLSDDWIAFLILIGAIVITVIMSLALSGLRNGTGEVRGVQGMKITAPAGEGTEEPDKKDDEKKDGEEEDNEEGVMGVDARDAEKKQKIGQFMTTILLLLGALVAVLAALAGAIAAGIILLERRGKKSLPEAAPPTAEEKL